MSNIKLFESKQIRTIWNEFDQKWYFSVQDVVQLLTNTTDVKDYIKKMKKRDAELNSNWGTICPLVENDIIKSIYHNSLQLIRQITIRCKN